MKICQLLPELNDGGVERGTIELSQYLIKNNHQSLVISNGGKLSNEIAGEHITLPIGTKSLTSLKYIKQLRKIFEDCDVIHSRSRLPAWLTYLAWKKMPVNKRPLFITTVHGFNSVSLYSKIMTFGERVIAVSDCIKKYIIRHYNISEDKIDVIHRGVDLQQYNRQYKPTQDWLDKWQQQYPDNGELNLLLAGRITQLKGIEHYIQAIELIKQQNIKVRGFVVGGIHPKRQKYYKTLQDFVKKHHLTEQIIFTGQRNDLRQIMSCVDIVCSTTLQQESFGRTCNEALALGTPFLGYNHGGIAEQLNTFFPQGCIDVGDYQSLANKAIQWAIQPPIIDDKPPLSLNDMLSKILQVYQKGLKERKN